MSTLVNPPPQLKIPDKFFNDPEIRSYFERQNTILFQLWQRTGGAFDAVAGKQIVVLANNDLMLDSSAYGSLIIVDASDNTVEITLPPISADTSGESVDIAVIDATFNVTVSTSGSETVLGDTSVLLTQQYMSIQFTVISTTAWIGT